VSSEALVLHDRDSDGDGTLDERLWVVQDANYSPPGGGPAGLYATLWREEKSVREFLRLEQEVAVAERWAANGFPSASHIKLVIEANNQVVTAYPFIP